MLSPENTLMDAGSKPVSYNLPVEVAKLVREEARADDRSASYIVGQILKRHYAKRLRARRVVDQRRAA